jgi:cyclopropane-fatty-acyl-phospholipid synthase
MPDYETFVRQALSLAGIEVNGNSHWDIHIHNPGFYKRIMTQRTLGLGESYMDEWWDCEAIDQLFYKLVRAGLHEKVALPLRMKAAIIFNRIFNVQNRSGSMKVVNKHYNPASETILAFLDPYNQYTCGYFKGTTHLVKAQEQKLDLVCRKLMLQPEDRVLDIGCGWGGFARFAAERHGCTVTGISNSSEQIEYAEKFCKGLPVTFVKSDYRSFKGKFTKVLVCGMIEHVGYKNYRKLMKMIFDCLEADGLFLLQTIAGNTSVYSGDPWLKKYVFPNSMLPSMKQLASAAEGLFIIEDVENFGPYYDATLMAWHKNFVAHWPHIKNQYDTRFYRMWTYYLLHMAGTFRARLNQLWQVLFSVKGVPG